MTLKPIFSESLLSHYISEFRLSSVADIRGITLKIKALVEELESGKIENAKEEEIKPRFTNTFFGDVLGFNYGNSNRWQLKDEMKSMVDGTKPDAALGYFQANHINDDVRALIEIKDAKTDLDKKQSRPDKQSSVEQAFGYVSKMGGNCKWVIISNIKEIRFYPSLDRSKCQVFLLKDLTNEDKLKELLFLFHKDRFIKENEQSSTDKLFDLAKTIQSKDDKPVHIIDKIYNSLKRFEGFGFIDPNYISTIYPFNILSEHVWHYHNLNLFTLNEEIYELLEGINVANGEVIFSNKLQAEVSALNIVDAKYKIAFVFNFFNHCLIYEISAVNHYQFNVSRNKNTIGFNHRIHFPFKEGKEGITKKIRIVKDDSCDCISCNYRNFDFNKFLSKLKAGIGNEDFNTSEYAFGNYLAASNNFKTTYNIYKAIEKETKGKQGKAIEYFLTKYNIKLLHNLILDYELEDSKELMDDIKSIDLDKVLYDEIEFAVDKDVKKYLIDFKEDVLIYKLQDEIEEITFDIEKLKSLYENGNKQFSGPDLPRKLSHKYFLLYLHVNTNYIIYDVFKRYKSLTEKVFKGLVISHQTPEFGLQTFNLFFLTEAIVHIPPDRLQEILKKVNELQVDDSTIENLLDKLNNFTSSYFKDGLFGDPYENSLLAEQLRYYQFEDRYTNIFTNLFTILSRVSISKEQFKKCKTSLLKFLKIEDELAWFDLKEFSNFLIKKGYVFEENDLKEVLKIAINRDKYDFNKYTDLIKQTSIAILNFYPNFKIDNIQLIKTALLKSCSDNGDMENYIHLVHLVNVCNENCKQIMYSAFEDYMNKRLNSDLYEELLLNTDYSYSTNNYFKKYSEYINLHKGGRAFKFGNNKLTDHVFMNYVLIIYKQHIDFSRPELKIFTNLNEFERWILDPFNFDYKDFDAKWLIDIHESIILERLKGNIYISNAIEKELIKVFDPVLAEIKYKYFTP